MTALSQETTDQQIAAFVRPTYLSLPPWEYDNTTTSLLNFNFRTMETSGLLLFHGDVQADFVAVELQQGRLKITLQIGEMRGGGNILETLETLE